MIFEDIPVFINSKDRVSCLMAMIARLERDKFRRIYICDTGSTYPPMLEYLQRSKHPIVHCEAIPDKAPKLLLWDRNVIRRTGHQGDWFIYTDSDTVPDERCPANWPEHLFRLIKKFPQFRKAGLGLKLSDIPDHYRFKKKVIAWESTYWGKILQKHVFASEIDTTIALYRPGTDWTLHAIRTGGPYLARHLPWYSNSANLSEEERYYIDHLHPKASMWTKKEIKR